MKKIYIKKPIPIEAIQYDGTNFDELAEFAGNDIYKTDNKIYVHSLEGDMRMTNNVGDYLVKGAIGEFFFCEKHLFEESYQEV